MIVDRKRMIAPRLFSILIAVIETVDFISGDNMDMSGIPNHRTPFSSSTCHKILENLSAAEFHGMKDVYENLEHIRVFNLQLFYHILNIHVGMDCWFGAKLTDKDKKILRDVAELDERIEKLYAEWKKQYPAIWDAIGIS
jgi:hypothetical protein